MQEIHPIEEEGESLLYQRARSLSETALPNLQKRLNEILRGLGDPYLIRARIDHPRIKSIASLRRKAAQRSWETLSEALTRTEDFLGFRIVCNNLQDVSRAVYLLRESLEKDGIRVKTRDYVRRPKPDGYRAIHILFQWPMRMGPDEMVLGCEVQVRSLLQDSWGHLSRDEIYASEAAIAGPIRKRMQNLSRLLARADNVADGIRRELVRPRKGKKPTSGQPLTRSAIAFIYRRAFGEDPPEYLVESTLRDFAEIPIRADGLEAALLNEEFTDQLRSAYAKFAKWEPDPSQIFRWVVHSLAKGRASALRAARNDGREEWLEIETIARSEELSDLP